VSVVGTLSVGSAQDAPSKAVILVSIDGLMPQFYLDSAWPAPFLQRMATEGAHVNRVEGVFPTLTYPSHTTLVTGALPIHHGVFYNNPFERDGPTGLWYWSFDSVRVPTIWEAANEKDLLTASIHWPVTTGAPIDYNVPEAWPADPTVSRLDFLKSVSTPPGILDEMEREATGRLVDYDAKGETDWWRYRYLDAKAIEMAAYLLATKKPNLLTIHLLSLDDALHEGIDTPKTREALAAVDGLVGFLANTIESLGLADSTTLIVTGDHGFLAFDDLLTPDAWLAESGLRAAAKDPGAWRARFHVKGGSAFLHLADRKDDAAVSTVLGLIDTMPETVRDRFRLILHEDLVGLGSDTSAALALAARPGTGFSGSVFAVPSGGTGATHGYLPTEDAGIYTGFVASGAGIRARSTVEQIKLTDVAPLVSYLLGLDLRAPDGHVPIALTTTSAQE